MNVISLIKSAVRGRTARRAGAQKGHAVERIPVYGARPSFLDTVEGCTLANAPRPVELAVLSVFNNFTRDVQHALTFAPGAGEHAERMQFWRDALSPALPPEIYKTAMGYIARALVRAGWGD